MTGRTGTKVAETRILRELLDALHRDRLDSVEFPDEIIRLLVQLVPCDDVSRVTLDPTARVTSDVTLYGPASSTMPDDPDFTDLFWAAYRADLVCSYPYRFHCVDQVLGAEDLMSPRELAKSLTGALFRLEAVRYNVIAPLWFDHGREHRLELFRVDGRPFSEREKLLLSLLRPHLADHARQCAAPSGSEADRLTARQRQLLDLVAQGLTNRQIADQLVLSEGTVRRHLENIYTRLGVSRRTAAVAVAHRAG